GAIAEIPVQARRPRKRCGLFDHRRERIGGRDGGDQGHEDAGADAGFAGYDCADAATQARMTVDSPQPSPPQKIIELTYAPPPPWFRRRRARRIATLISALLLAAVVALWAPRIIQRYKANYWAQRCAAHTAPSDSVVSNTSDDPRDRKLVVAPE